MSQRGPRLVRYAPRLLSFVVLALSIAANLSLVAHAGDEPMPVAEFNRQTVDAHQHGESWTRSARSTASRFVGENCCKSTAIREDNIGRIGKRVTITNQGAEDDSIRGYRFRVTLTKALKTPWQIDRAGRAWNCWPGRGHQYFSTARCN